MQKGDMLDMDKINSLPHPLWFGEWPAHTICVQTGLMHLDVCGMFDNHHFASYVSFKDAEGNEHFTEDFYLEGSP